MKIFLIAVITLVFSADLFSQTFTNHERLKELAEQFRERYQAEKDFAVQWAIENGFAIRQVLENGTVMSLRRIENGTPIYYVTDNADAAETISTNEVWAGGAAGLNLDGTGVTIGEWDGGEVLSTHQELTGRVTQEDSPSSTSEHSTHVAGTMLGSGVNADAQGMAEGATLSAWDFDNDTAEMSAAASSLLVSNHSYGFSTGWTQFVFWAGDSNIDPNEDWKFGYYTLDTQEHDNIAYNAPYYLICKSAGNDRGDFPIFGPPPPADGDVDGGYDTLGPVKTAKNILTVGAVEDILGGYTGVSDVVMSSFSSWGPTDDGRIKPDVVGNGVELISASDGGTSSYATLSGTSMATPNVTGSLALIIQHYSNLSGGSAMRAATLKALAIHTADEAGSADGPDYIFGWGLFNTQTAAELLSEVFVSQDNHTVQERVLNNNDSYSIQVTSDGLQPMRVTICWTDVEGTPAYVSTGDTIVDPTNLMLVNDLDLRVTEGGNTYFPWILDPANPSNAATTADNFRDNVEQVYIASPSSGDYTITVNHKNSLTNGSQAFSLIMSGAYFSDQSLPVGLSTFSATQYLNNVKLHWLTESEEKNLGFEIYRAEEDGDFHLIADYRNNPQLKGSGNSSTMTEYSYLDENIKTGRIYRYKLADVDYAGKRTYHETTSVYIDADKFSNDLNLENIVADEFKLLTNYPNPFNPQTKISFTLPQETNVSLNIYNEQGKLITTLVEQKLGRGSYAYNWVAQNLPSGIYFYTLTANGKSKTRKMILLK